MIIDKINLQKDFGTLFPNATEGSLLRFKSDGTLEVVSSSSQGILPQIKVLSHSNTVTCSKSGGGTIQPSASISRDSYYIKYYNVPTISPSPGYDNYSITISGYNNGSPVQVHVDAYKQYVVNAL